jgi:hypothetical protein
MHIMYMVLLVIRKNVFNKLIFKDIVGKHSRIQLRILLNKNNSVIECIYVQHWGIFYTT